MANVLCLLTSAATAAAAESAQSPRATMGDSVVEPAWEQRLTITVGPAKAEIVGTSEKALQAAVDYVARLGGGTVKILPGTYRLRNAVYLQSKVRLLGSGSETVLIKEPSVTTTLAADSDWYDQEITLTDATGFELGDGVCLRTEKDAAGKIEVVKRTLVARTGNRFKLDRGLRENFWRRGEATVSTLFPIISGENISDIAIENLVLDGNRAKNENLNGNYVGCVFLQECNRVVMRGITARNFNGDGMSWQVCHDVLVEKCTSEDHAGLGLHPGSGSQRTVMRNNRLTGNHIGIYFCWGVRHGLAEKNHIEDNNIGISIGHRDTDNVVRDNDIIGSKRVGLLFRPEHGPGFTGDRNRIENNRFVNNGPEDGFAVDVQGVTESIELIGNEITDTRSPAKGIAIRLGPETGNITLRDNRIQGFAKEMSAEESLTRKKLIEFGWDEPDTAFMRKHAAQMDATPFDGCVYHMRYLQPDGTDADFIWSCWGRRAFTIEQVQHAIDDLKATHLKRLRDNFMRFNVTPGDLDWFEDYTAVVTNAYLAARVAREGGVGILFDTEQYNSQLFDYRKQPGASTNTWEQYATQARQRGREVMNAFQAGFPGLKVLMTFGYGSKPWQESDGGKRPLRECSYGLLAPFLDGMIDAAQGKTQLIDGCESAYSYFEEKKFRTARKMIQTDVLAMVADREKYQKVFSTSFGLWMDYQWQERGWNVEHPERNPWTPEKFEAIVRTALAYADEYVWIYTETPRWWSDQGGPIKLPPAYDAAIRRAALTNGQKPAPAPDQTARPGAGTTH